MRFRHTFMAIVLAILPLLVGACTKDPTVSSTNSAEIVFTLPTTIGYQVKPGCPEYTSFTFKNGQVNKNLDMGYGLATLKSAPSQALKGYIDVTITSDRPIFGVWVGPTVRGPWSFIQTPGVYLTGKNGTHHFFVLFEDYSDCRGVPSLNLPSNFVRAKLRKSGQWPANS